MRIHLRGATLRHGNARGARAAAVRELDLDLAAGEQVAIVGSSGAGKTSLLHLLACALRPDAGLMRLDGIDPWTLRGGARHRLRRRLFLAPQTPPLPPRQRVVTAVLAGGLPAMGLWRSVRSLFYPLDIGAAQAALQAFGMEGRLFDRVDRLSGGERQRVSLARAFLAPADIWLLDEPLAALDPALAQACLQALQHEARRRGVTLVVSMHQVELARASFARLLGLSAGTLLFDGASTAVDDGLLARLFDGEREAGPDDAAASAGTFGPMAARRVTMLCR